MFKIWIKKESPASVRAFSFLTLAYKIIEDRPQNRKKNHSNDPKNLLFCVFITFNNIDYHNDINDKNEQ
jgi:hypothetical protein